MSSSDDDETASVDPADGRGKERLLFAVELKPGSRESALKLLQDGPPFDPAETALAAHDAFLLDDEAVFFFETDDLETLAKQAQGFWESGTAWRELMTGNVRLAEHLYSWTRPKSG
jgi:hypothetical protein